MGNPDQFRVISESVKKTSRRDAALLAEYLEKALPAPRRRKLLTIVCYTLKNHWVFSDSAAFAVEG